VAILAPLRREMRALEARTEITHRWSTEPLRAALGQLEGTSVILACTGDGAVNAARSAEALFDRVSAGGVIVVGVAGALSPRLEPGQVLVAREVIEAGGSVPPPDAEWLRRVLRKTGATPATLVSEPRIVGSSGAKAKSYAALPHGTVAAVDLETAALARIAAEHGLPYVALRAISDTAEESLPLDFNLLRDGTGAVDPRRVALRALTRPALLAPLWRMRARIALCSENLARAVYALLAGGFP
jgi:adenosylhomocysteine nucleosidase